MKSNFERISVEISGSSHSDKIGISMSGLPSDAAVCLSDLKAFMKRRSSGSGVWSTPRKESDEINFESGVEIDGDKIIIKGGFSAYIENKNIKPSDYENTLNIPRPSHADFVMFARDGKTESGGGRFSGRMTAPLCIGGGIAKQLLENAGVGIHAYISQIGSIEAESYLNCDLSDIEWSEVEKSPLPTLSADRRDDMIFAVKAASCDGDSLGGIIDCVVSGVQAGVLGDALFEGLEGKIAYSVFAVPAVKGVEFGAGFALAGMRGSGANDGFYYDGGKVKTRTNNSGGLNGGISNGMPITMRAVIRPTPSISKLQKSVDLTIGSDAEIRIRGRHDACIVPRAVPCVESAVALALLDEALKRGIII